MQIANIRQLSLKYLLQFILLLNNLTILAWDLRYF